MKVLKKMMVLLLTTLILVSFTACSKGQDADKTNNGENQGNANVSGEIYEFKFELLGDTYTLPADLNEFKDNGWEYIYNDNPESKKISANSYETCDVVKDGKRITLFVINLSTSARKFTDCKVGRVDCTFSSENDVTVKLAKRLSATKKTSLKDVTGKFGEATDTVSSETGTTLRYQQESHVYYTFEFDTEDKLTEIYISNRIADEDSANDPVELDLSFMNEYKEPTALTDNYADYIFKLEGDLYQLPVPVSALIDNGWEITAQPESIWGDSEKKLGLMMKKGDIELAFTVKNFADAPVEPKDAMITGLSINSESVEGIDFELSGGIIFGMSDTDFESKPFASKFKIGDAILGGTKYSYFEPSNTIALSFKDGKLYHVSCSKNTLGE